MLSQPLVSILIPVRNGEQYIRKTIESVLSQDYQNLQIIISENHSIDKTFQILSEIRDPRITVIRPSKLLSASQNWTFVTEHASGKYSKLLCADDFLPLDTISRQVRILESNEELQLTSGRRSIVDEKDRILISSRGLNGIAGIQLGGQILEESFIKGTNIIGEPGAVMFRTATLLRNLPWTSESTLMLDFDMYRRVLKTGNFFGDHDVSLYFRVHDRSLTSYNFFRHYHDFSHQYKLYRESLERSPLSNIDILGMKIRMLIGTVGRVLVFHSKIFRELLILNNKFKS
jgi:glycosyltransferase involved in cell wall biosynthesis